MIPETPRLEIFIDRMAHNAHHVVQQCVQRGVQVAAVTKVMQAHPALLSAFADSGAAMIADSRIDNLKRVAEAGLGLPTMLLRTPTPGRAAEAVRWADCSLISSNTAAAALSRAAEAAEVTHQVVVMVDVGDLREGVWPDRAVDVVTRYLVDHDYSGGILIPVILVLGMGALLGAFNGAFTSRLAVPTLIITLGTANVFSGVMQGALNSVQIPQLPTAMAEFGRASLFTVTNPESGLTSTMPVAFLLLILVVAIAFLIMRHTMFGRAIHALGGDETAAVRAGFKVRWVKFWLYVIVGVIAALSGLVRTSMMGQMHPTNLLGIEMLVIAAVVLGGTAITGGTGSLTGVMLGTLLIVMVSNSMILSGIPTMWQRFALGLLIIVGTGISAVQLTRRRRRQRLVAE